MHTLQALIQMDPELANDSSLYFRQHPNSVSTDTFFNLFSVTTWTKTTFVNSISASATTSIPCNIELIHTTLDGIQVILFKFFGQEVITPEIKLSDLGTGTLSFRFWNISSSCILDAKFCTRTPPKLDAKIGIVITTFNRQLQARTAIERILRKIRSLDIAEKNLYKVLVIDNGRNLGIESTDTCRVIENNNLGGTGGFTRGLIELAPQDSFTHCLFMDDDASCHFESIQRTRTLFSYAIEQDLAISGAMLFKDTPHIQWEFTARFKPQLKGSVCAPIGSGRNVSSIVGLLENEKTTLQLTEAPPKLNCYSPDYPYGGWWYFAFPIRRDIVFPFPFFVRGDDVYFSIHNRFKIIAMNGVSSWQESFDQKDAPLTIYLSYRQEFINILALRRLSLILKCIYVSKLAFVNGFRHALKFQYSYTECVIQALIDVGGNSEFWKKALNFEKHLKPLTRKLAFEWVTLNKTTGFNYSLNKRFPQIYPFLTPLKLITLNGHLIPGIFFKKNAPIFEPRQIAKLNDLFFFEQYFVLEWGGNNQARIFRRNRRVFASAILRLMLAVLGFFLNLAKISNFYSNPNASWRTKHYWIDIFGLPRK